MDLEQLCKRENNNYSIEEFKKLVRDYIFERKNVDVVIDLKKVNSIVDAMNPMFPKEQQEMLVEAGLIAKRWFNENKFKTK